MIIELFDLAAADENVRFSPNCWRTRLCLAHKGLPVTTIPWRFTEKEKIAFSGQGLVPVIRDNGKSVNDSWAIAVYLDATYPNLPKLFEGPQALALTSFVRYWAQTNINPIIQKTILLDLFASLADQDKAYFRQSREARFGMSLEQAAISPNEGFAALRQALAPLRSLLQAQDFVAGARPAFADYVVFGTFQWARAVSPIKLLAEDDRVYAWRERVLDLYDGLARKAPIMPQRS